MAFLALILGLLLLAGLLFAMGAYVALMVLLSHMQSHRPVGRTNRRTAVAVRSNAGHTVHLRVIRPAHAFSASGRTPASAIIGMPERRRT